MTIDFYFEFRDLSLGFLKMMCSVFVLLRHILLAKSQDTNRLRLDLIFLNFHLFLEDKCHPQNDMLDSFVY